jgi:hypothetical protein
VVVVTELVDGRILNDVEGKPLRLVSMGGDTVLLPQPLSSVSYFKFLYNYFLNFIVKKINSKIIKYGMVVLIKREKT